MAALSDEPLPLVEVRTPRFSELTVPARGTTASFTLEKAMLVAPLLEVVVTGSKKSAVPP